MQNRLEDNAASLNLACHGLTMDLAEALDENSSTVVRNEKEAASRNLPL
jgi:hypothetical protein